MEEELNKLQYWRLYMLMVVLGFGGTFQYGIQISTISAPAVHIQRFVNNTWMLRYGVPVTDSTNQFLWSFTVAILSIGAMVGSLCIGWITVTFGRKKTILFNNVVAVVAAPMMLLSRTANSFEMILVGRFLFGFNAGLGLFLHLMYVVESSPGKLRGVLTATCSIFLAFGKVTGQIISIRELLGTEEMWPYLLSFGSVPAIFQFVTILFFPEAPRYIFIDKGDIEGTKKALQWLWQEDDLKQELDALQKEKDSSQERTKSVKDVLTSRCVRWQLLTLLILCGVNQLCGFTALYFYAFDILRESGVPEDKINYYSIGIGLTEFVTVTLSLLYIDRVGRKMLMGCGYLMMGVTMAALTACLSFKHFNSMMPYVNIALVFSIICIFGLGPSGVCYALSGEVFLQAWRPSAFVIVGTTNWLSMFIVGLSFGYVVDNLGEFCFLIFMAYCFLSGAFMLYFIPETKGKTIVEITEDFNKINFRKRSRDGDSADTNVTADLYHKF